MLIPIFPIFFNFFASLKLLCHMSETPTRGSTRMDRTGRPITPCASHEQQQSAHYDGDSHTYYHVQIAQIFLLSSFAPHYFNPSLSDRLYTMMNKEM